jgi:hypothetical protein
MEPSSQDQIRRIYICQAREAKLFVFLFLEHGTRPRAIARVDWGREGPFFVAFPDLPLRALEERVGENLRAFSTQYGAPIFTIEAPGGCDARELMRWLRFHWDSMPGRAFTMN